MARPLTIVIFCALIFHLAACKKENSPQTDPPQNLLPARSKDLNGFWELRRVYGGLITTQYLPGNGNTLTFYDSTYLRFVDGLLYKAGTYYAFRDTAVSQAICGENPGGVFDQRVIYDNNYSGQKIYFHVSNDTLTFVTGCFEIDGGANIEYLLKH